MQALGLSSRSCHDPPQAFYIFMKEMDVPYTRQCQSLACMREGTHDLASLMASNVTASVGCTYTEVILCPPRKTLMDDGGKCLASFDDL